VRCEGYESREGGFTFLSLFFSATSSLPALAACRFSCFAVNYGISVSKVVNLSFKSQDICQIAYLEVEERLLETGHREVDSARVGL